jgi:hypothetical protein
LWLYLLLFLLKTWGKTKGNLPPYTNAGTSHIFLFIILQPCHSKLYVATETVINKRKSTWIQQTELLEQPDIRKTSNDG